MDGTTYYTVAWYNRAVGKTESEKMCHWTEDEAIRFAESAAEDENKVRVAVTKTQFSVVWKQGNNSK